MKELICIVCPRGCRIVIDDDNKISGAACRKGKEFAQEENVSPKRTVCSVVATIFKDYPLLPVRTSQEIPKDKVQELMRIINSYVLTKRVNRGEILIPNLFGTTSHLIATSSMLYDYYE